MITILDGGMGKELRRIGAPFRQPEWSALALLEAPDTVSQAHRNFIEAGAEVIITNTYALVPFHLGDDRFAQRGRELATLAARLARSAADDADRPVLVAGSLPPVFGSYRPDEFDEAVAPDRWRMLIEAQLDHVDLWVGETMSSLAEFACLRAVLSDMVPDASMWAAFTLADVPVDGPDGPRAVLRSGESISDVAQAVASGDGADGVVDTEAVLFNCSQPEMISLALGELASVVAATGASYRLGAYANAFPEEEIDESEYSANERIIERREDLTPDRYAEFAAGWIEAGATIIGGCCDIYPEHITALARLKGPSG